MCALRARLDDVERLCAEGCDHSRYTTICKVRHGVLWNVSCGLEVFEDVVGSHSKGSRGGLLQCRSHEPMVEPKDAVFGIDDAGCMEARTKALLVTGIVYKRGFYTFGRGDGCDGGNNAGRHARGKVSERGEGSGSWVCEAGLDDIEEEEADGIFSYRALCGCSARVQLEHRME